MYKFLFLQKWVGGQIVSLSAVQKGSVMGDPNTNSNSSNVVSVSVPVAPQPSGPMMTLINLNTKPIIKCYLDEERTINVSDIYGTEEECTASHDLNLVQGQIKSCSVFRNTPSCMSQPTCSWSGRCRGEFIDMGASQCQDENGAELPISSDQCSGTAVGIFDAESQDETSNFSLASVVQIGTNYFVQTYLADGVGVIKIAPNNSVQEVFDNGFKISMSNVSFNLGTQNYIEYTRSDDMHDKRHIGTLTSEGAVTPLLQTPMPHGGSVEFKGSYGSSNIGFYFGYMKFMESLDGINFNEINFAEENFQPAGLALAVVQKIVYTKDYMYFTTFENYQDFYDPENLEAYRMEYYTNIWRTSSSVHSAQLVARVRDGSYNYYTAAGLFLISKEQNKIGYFGDFRGYSANEDVGNGIYYSNKDRVYQMWGVTGDQSPMLLIQSSREINEHNGLSIVQHHSHVYSYTDGTVTYLKLNNQDKAHWYRTDGTPEGTVDLMANVANEDNYANHVLGVINGVLYATITTPEHGTEIYKSVGNSMVLDKETLPGDASMGPLSDRKYQAVHGNDIYFMNQNDYEDLGFSRIHKYNIVTKEITRLETPSNVTLFPGFRIVGSKLFIEGNTSDKGTEPFILDLE